MKFVCDSCGTQYLISDEKVGSRGVKVRCKRCGNVILVRPHQHDEEPESPGQAELGGSTQPDGSPFPGEGGESGAEEGDELGQAFDRLLQGDLSLGEDESEAADDNEEQETQIFSRDEIMRSSGALTDEDQHKIDEVFSAAASTDVTAGHGAQDAGEEWYLAINDEQVGPMDLAEVEHRWEQGEIGPTTLAWFAGMSDWQPISDVPRLRYLLGSRSKKPEPAAAVETAAGPPGQQWNTSASSELSALVEEEIQAVRQKGLVPDEAEDGGTGRPEQEAGEPEETPPWEKEDVLSGEVARPSESYFDPSLDAPTTDSGAPLTDRAGIVKPAYLAGEGNGTSRRKWLLLGGAGAVVVLGAVVLLMVLPGDDSGAKRTSEPRPLRPAAGAGVQAGTRPGGKKQDRTPQVAEGGVAKTTGKKQADSPSSAEKSDSTPGKGDRDASGDTLVVKKPVAGPDEQQPGKVTSTKPEHTASPSRKRQPTRSQRKVKKRHFSSRAGAHSAVKPRVVSLAPAPPAAANLPEKLTPAQIKGVMKKYLGAMRKCVKMQKERDPSVKGTMLVTFTITGDGTTTAVKVLSTEHRNTFVAACITTVISKIKFPRFSGSPIRIPKVPLKLGD